MDKWMVDIELFPGEFRRRTVRNLTKRQARKLADEVVRMVTANEFTSPASVGLFLFDAPNGEQHYLRLAQVVSVSAERMPNYMLDDEPKAEEKTEETT